MSEITYEELDQLFDTLEKLKETFKNDKSQNVTVLTAFSLQEQILSIMQEMEQKPKETKLTHIQEMELAIFGNIEVTGEQV